MKTIYKALAFLVLIASSSGFAQFDNDSLPAQPVMITAPQPINLGNRGPAGLNGGSASISSQIDNLDPIGERAYTQCMQNSWGSPHTQEKKSSDCLTKAHNVSNSIGHNSGFDPSMLEDHEFTSLQSCLSRASGADSEACYAMQFPGKRSHMTGEAIAGRGTNPMTRDECIAHNNSSISEAGQLDCSKFTEQTGREGGGGSADEKDGPYQPETPPDQEDQKIEYCLAAGQKVTNDCNTEAQSWMKNIQMVSQGVGPIMQQMNPDACQTLAATNVGTSSSLAVFKTMCNTATVECEAACKEVKSPTSDVDQAKATMASCKQKGTKAAEAEQQAAAATGQIMQAVNACTAAFGTTNPFDNMTNNPYQGKTADEILNNLNGAASGSMNHAGVGGGGASSDGTSGRGGFSLDLEEEEQPKSGQRMAGGAGGGDIGGSKGGGAPGSRGGAAGGPAGNRRNQGGVMSKIGNILSGFFGGRGGGVFGGSGGSRGGGAGGGFGPAQAAVQQQPDLRQFMPTTAHKTRGVAGGVSGAHGNIWKMINNRYQAKRSTLLPR